MNPDCPAPFAMLAAIKKEHVVLNELCEIRKVAGSKNYSNKYKANHTLFFLIPSREEARYLLTYSCIYQSDLSSCGQALYLTVEENLGIYRMK